MPKSGDIAAPAVLRAFLRTEARARPRRRLARIFAVLDLRDAIRSARSAG